MIADQQQLLGLMCYATTGVKCYVVIEKFRKVSTLLEDRRFGKVRGFQMFVQLTESSLNSIVSDTVRLRRLSPRFLLW